MTKTTAARISRGLYFSLAVLGVFGIAPIAWQQLVGSSVCPLLGPIPACYIVLSGYLLVALSSLISDKRRWLLFAVGWLPLFALAATGTALESVGVDACPKTASGIPACYLSLALLVALAVPAWISRYSDQSLP